MVLFLGAVHGFIALITMAVTQGQDAKILLTSECVLCCALPSLHGVGFSVVGLKGCRSPGADGGVGGSRPSSRVQTSGIELLLKFQLEQGGSC